MKLTDLKVKDKIRITNNDCVPAHAIKEVKKDRQGLYVTCTDGKHYLEGQLREDGELAGVERV